MRVKFGKVDIAQLFYDPIEGPVDYQTLRRQPFGGVGVLELRGKQGGQSIDVPVRVVKKNYALLRSAINLIYVQTGKHENLVLEFQSGADGSYVVGQCTFDAALPLTPPRRLAYDTSLGQGGYEARFVLRFFRLSPPNEKSGFGS